MNTTAKSSHQLHTTTFSHRTHHQNGFRCELLADPCLGLMADPCRELMADLSAPLMRGGIKAAADRSLHPVIDGSQRRTPDREGGSEPTGLPAFHGRTAGRQIRPLCGHRPRAKCAELAARDPGSDVSFIKKRFVVMLRFKCEAHIVHSAYQTSLSLP